MYTKTTHNDCCFFFTIEKFKVARVIVYLLVIYVTTDLRCLIKVTLLHIAMKSATCTFKFWSILIYFSEIVRKAYSLLISLPLHHAAWQNLLHLHV